MQVSPTREQHRAEYAHLLDRLTNAMRMSPEQQREWGPTIEDLARKCNDHRARYLQVTEDTADEMLGTVLEVASGIVECERATKTNLTETLGAMGVEHIDDVTGDKLLEAVAV